MSILICTKCDRPFDTDKQVEAQYAPLPVCEDCLIEEEWQPKLRVNQAD